MREFALTVGGQTIESPAGLPKSGNEAGIFSNAMSIFITITIVVTVIFVIWAGIQWVMSGGDKQKVAAARAKLTWGIIGLVVALSAFLLINMFSYFFGVNLLNFNL